MNYIDTGFSAKTWDKETGLYNFPQRYYDARNVKWMTLDPMGIELMNPMEQGEDGKMVPKPDAGKVTSLNWYNYCSNNPIVFIDPEGTTDFSFLNRILKYSTKTENTKMLFKSQSVFAMNFILSHSGFKYGNGLFKLDAVEYNCFIDQKSIFNSNFREGIKTIGNVTVQNDVTGLESKYSFIKIEIYETKSNIYPVGIKN